MAVSPKQVKKKLRLLARQDAPLPGNMPGREGYQFFAPHPQQRKRHWIPALVSSVACLAVAVTAMLLAFPFIRGGNLPAASSAESHLPSATEVPVEPSPIPIAWVDSVKEWVPYEGPEAAIGAPVIERFRSVEEFRRHLAYYPGFQPGFDGWDQMSVYGAVQYGILERCLQEELYDEHELVWIRMCSSTPSQRYIVEGAERTGAGTVTIRFTEIGDGVGDAVLESWEFFLLLPREMLRESDTITAQVEQTVILRRQADLTQPEWDAAEATVGSFDRYYGAFGDCLVIGSDITGDEEAPAAEEVCGRVFDYAEQAVAIEVLHGGERSSLTTAYEQGWLTDKDVEEIYFSFRLGSCHLYQGHFYY